METSSYQPKTPIEYCGFFNQTGYGKAASTNVFALHQTGRYDVRIHCINTRPTADSFTDEDWNLLRSMRTKRESSDAIQIVHSIPDQYRRCPFRKRCIAFATFETFDPPEHWIGHLNKCDAVFVPSEFNLRTFSRAGVKVPIFHIPHVLDLSVWNADIEPLYKQPEFVFAFVGTWRRRKGYDLLLEAYMREFGPDENVRLLIKTDSANKASESIRSMKQGLQKKETAPITLERKILREPMMARFLKSANCLVSPTLGEGFGLPPLQAMAVKVPVIVTNFAGCQDYADETNCTLLEPSGFLCHDKLDPIPQFAYKKWPRVKVLDVQEAMRAVFENYQEAQRKADIAYERVQNNYGYDTFVAGFDQMLENVYSGGHAKTQAIQRYA